MFFPPVRRDNLRALALAKARRLCLRTGGQKVVQQLNKVVKRYQEKPTITSHPRRCGWVVIVAFP